MTRRRSISFSRCWSLLRKLAIILTLRTFELAARNNLEELHLYQGPVLIQLQNLASSSGLVQKKVKSKIKCCKYVWGTMSKKGRSKEGNTIEMVVWRTESKNVKNCRGGCCPSIDKSGCIEKNDTLFCLKYKVYLGSLIVTYCEDAMLR